VTTPTPHVAVVGTGYVGLTTAACLAHLGRDVTAIDIDRTKIDRLQQGELPILERGLDQLVTDGLDSGRLTFTTSYRPVAQASIVMLCLPTPLRDDGALDLAFIEQAATTLRQLLAADAVVRDQVNCAGRDPPPTRDLARPNRRTRGRQSRIPPRRHRGCRFLGP